MDRKEFLSATVGAFACACLAACKSDENTAPSPTTSSFTVDTADSANAALNTDGGSLVKNGVIIATISAANSQYTAVQVACTHEGTAVNFQGSSGFRCPNHGARFDINGNVTQGPATRALKKYTVSKSGTVLTITP